MLSAPEPQSLDDATQQTLDSGFERFVTSLTMQAMLDEELDASTQNLSDPIESETAPDEPQRQVTFAGRKLQSDLDRRRRLDRRRYWYLSRARGEIRHERCRQRLRRGLH